MSNDGRFIVAHGVGKIALIDAKSSNPTPWKQTLIPQLENKPFQAHAVNERGDIVGFIDGTNEPFVYTAETGSVRLTTKLRGFPAGLALGPATDINNHREITAHATRAGVVRAVRIKLPRSCWAQAQRCPIVP